MEFNNNIECCICFNNIEPYICKFPNCGHCYCFFCSLNSFYNNINNFYCPADRINITCFEITNAHDNTILFSNDVIDYED